MELSFQVTDSEAIEKVHYSSDTKILTVKFVNGGTYHYFDVDQSVYNSFAKAESAGTFYIQYVKSGFKYYKSDEK